jgi:hypothetical protein
MKNQEFKDYLKSIGGLVGPNGDIIFTKFCSCSEGWNKIIADLISELISAGWDKRILQAKEKFGGLRFYIPNTTKELIEIILKYEKISYHTCEICGENKTSKIRRGSWIRTLCDECYEK